MKTRLITTLLLACTALAGTAATNDSVYVRAYAPNPQSGLRLDYSADMKTWVNVGNGYELFRSEAPPPGERR